MSRVHARFLVLYEVLKVFAFRLLGELVNIGDLEELSNHGVIATIQPGHNT